MSDAITPVTPAPAPSDPSSAGASSEIVAADGAPKVRFFPVLATLLDAIDTGLNTPQGGVPRWLRIARAARGVDATVNPENTLPKIVGKAVGGFVLAVDTMGSLVLSLEKNLTQTDALIALLAVGKDLMAEVTSERFLDAMNESLGSSISDVLQPLRGSGEIVSEAFTYVEYAPTVEDMEKLKQSLYRLLRVTRKEDGTIDVALTGKVRLIQWAFGLSVTRNGEKSVVLGCRPLGNGGSLPKGAEIAIVLSADHSLTLSCGPADAEGKDVAELRKLLAAYGYTGNDLPKAAAAFALANKMPEGSSLDAVAERVLSLNHEKGRLDSPAPAPAKPAKTPKSPKTPKPAAGSGPPPEPESKA